MARKYVDVATNTIPVEVTHRKTNVMTDNAKKLSKRLGDHQWTKLPSREVTPPTRETTPIPMRYVPPPRDNRWMLPMIAAGLIGTAALTHKYWMPPLKRGVQKLNPYLIGAQNGLNKVTSMLNRTTVPTSVPHIANITSGDD